ncbi:MAG: DUF1648 domain-containing protein [Myxococcota bacterium]|jgi:uncharacterized membrane protein
MKITSSLQIALVAVAGVQISYFWGLMPPMMASHFGAGGQPNGWMNKESFVAIYVMVLALLNVIPLIGAIIIKKVPRSMINLPNKEYWLAPERIDRTAGMFMSYMEVFSAGITAFMVFVFQLAFRANIEKTAMDSMVMFIAIGALVAFSIAWSIMMILAFRVPKARA